MTQLELEHELASALRKVDEQSELLQLCKEENEEKRKDVVWLATEKAKLEDIIKRAGSAFFVEGSDKETSVAMLAILEESR